MNRGCPCIEEWREGRRKGGEREGGKEKRHKWRERENKEGKEGGRKRLQGRKDGIGVKRGEKRDLRGRRRRLVWQGVAGHLWDPEASTVAVQSATQDVLYPFLLNCWDILGLTCRNPFNFLNGSLTIQDRVRHKYNAGLLAELGL